MEEDTKFFVVLDQDGQDYGAFKSYLDAVSELNRVTELGIGAVILEDF